jgi:hypothetical protein
MKTKSTPTSNTTLYLVAAKGDLGIDQLIEVEKASVATVVRLHTDVGDLYKNPFWFAPVFGDLLDIAAKSFTLCVKLQMDWLAMMMPQISHSSEPLQVAAPSNTGTGSSAQPKEELERSMDIAIGEGFGARGSTIESSSGSDAQSVPHARAQSA